MHLDDALAFLLDYIKTPRDTQGYPLYGYEIYLPNVIVAYLREIERKTEHISNLYSGKEASDLSPVFYEAAWNLCRRGILRPGIRRLGLQATDDGASGNGYSVTSHGRDWSTKEELTLILSPSRLGELFAKFAEQIGTGFQQRASEAVYCHSAGAYLACCAMSGAAAESVLIAVAIQKHGDEATVLATYRTSRGRQRTIDGILAQKRETIASQFRSATSLLAYWRDDAAHGTASTISEIEAHEALSRLLRFAQFTSDNWNELTT